MGDNEQYDVVVVGGGASGMMAACTAAKPGAHVLLLEKNDKLGKKLYITGKGRCNFTNDCTPEDFLQNVPCNPRFLYSSICGFDSREVISWFEEHGMRTKVERGNRAFPLSDHASDVTRTLEREMNHLGVGIRLNSEVRELLTAEGRIRGVLLSDGARIHSDCVILATGGISYPSTGSTGDGYRFARAAGHKVLPLTASLVPLETAEEDIFQMQGLSLKNVSLKIRDGKKKIFDEFGEMMFTHFGITGPLVLSASANIQDRIRRHPLDAWIDLKPALDQEKLDLRIQREFEQNHNKAFCNSISGLYPAKMIPVIIKRCKIAADKPCHDITRQERAALVNVTKQFTLTITALRSLREAVITHGGVSVREVDPSTMESRLVKGLYLTGELLDVDAYTGGFNLQIAWATGHAAGAAAAGRAGF